MTKKEVYQGNTLRIQVNVVDKASGDASDLTGKSGLLVVTEKRNDEEPLFELDSTSVSEGQVVFDLTPTETTRDAGTYLAEVILTQADPEYVKTILQFQLVVKESLKY